MRARLRRSPLLLTFAAMAACSWLAATAAGHWVDARYRVEPAPGGRLAVGPRPRRVLPPSKDGGPLVARNPFCSGCAGDGGDPPGDPPGAGIPLTRLPLRLVATNLAASPHGSFATIRDTSARGSQGGYWLGDRVPGGGPIERIAGTEVIFARAGGGGRERLVLVPPADDGPIADAADPARPRSPWDDRIARIDDTTYEVDRGLVRELVAGPVGGAAPRVRPLVEEGEVRGFQLLAVRPGSLAAALGLVSGDVIEAVDGVPLDSPDRLLEVYGKVRERDGFEVALRRDGQRTTRRYRFR